IVDYLALVGDTVDNIPGVPKCGPKTAVKWLQEFGTLDNLMRRAHEVGGKIGENLRDTLDQLPLSKQLATIHTEVTLDCTLDELAHRHPDLPDLRRLYEMLEFRGWLAELDGAEQVISPEPAANTSPSPAPTEARYET